MGNYGLEIDLGVPEKKKEPSIAEEIGESIGRASAPAPTPTPAPVGARAQVIEHCRRELESLTWKLGHNDKEIETLRQRIASTQDNLSTCEDARARMIREKAELEKVVEELQSLNLEGRGTL